MGSRAYYLCYKDYSGENVTPVREKLDAASRREACKEAKVVIQRIRDENKHTDDRFVLKEEVILFDEVRPL